MTKSLMLEALRPRIKGAGNLERLDYWLNLIRASQLRVQTWVLADRLAVRRGAWIVTGRGNRRRLAEGQGQGLKAEDSLH